jgi:hypothetical protein
MRIRLVIRTRYFMEELFRDLGMLSYQDEGKYLRIAFE